MGKVLGTRVSRGLFPKLQAASKSPSRIYQEAPRIGLGSDPVPRARSGPGQGVDRRVWEFIASEIPLAIPIRWVVLKVLAYAHI